MKNESASILTTDDEPGPALQSVKACGRLEGLVLSMTTSQVFRNTTKKNMEVVYTFPLAWGSVLLGMEVTLGNIRRRGQVMPKEEANERYEQAVEKGDAPVMVEKQPGGLYSASIGGLKPGEDLVIDISYAQLLRFEQGRVRLSLPTTVSPRFGDATGDAGFDQDRAPGSDLLVEYPFTLKLEIVGEISRAKINCPSHTVTQQASEDGVCVSLERKAWLDRDFILFMENLEGKSFAITGPDPKSGEGHTATLASFCPTVSTMVSTALNIKILVDCSGSMQGDSIELAREALGGLSKLLSSKDTFSLSRFGSTTERLLPAIDASLIGTTRLSFGLRKLKADLGGTEMRSAIEDTFEIDFPPNESKAEADLLLITDGEVWDALEIVHSAKASGHRIYALGVGSAPAESLLQELAESTGGACEMVSPNEDMSEAIERMVSRMRQAQPVKATLVLNEEQLWTSPMPKRITNDETVHLFIRTRRALTSSPALMINNVSISPEVIEHTQKDLIARLMGAQQAGLCRDTDEATAIAQAYQVVTEHTNLLLVFERAESEKTNGMPDLHQVQHMTSAGWSGAGSIRLSRDRSSNVFHQPAVYRSNRVSESHSSSPRFSRSSSQKSLSINKLPSGGFNDIEIPAFLMKQADIKSPETTDLELKRLAESLIAEFNAAADVGQKFRQTVRALLMHSNEAILQDALDSAQIHVETLLNAWACLILWAATKASTRLSKTSSKLIDEQIHSVEFVNQARAMEEIDKALTNTIKAG